MPLLLLLLLLTGRKQRSAAVHCCRYHIAGGACSLRGCSHEG